VQTAVVGIPERSSAVTARWVGGLFSGQLGHVASDAQTLG
jgi:hypothetical protein